ncbi:MAG: hypothetical protein ABJA78_08710 [Ferruginibacter sp.]
MGNDAKIYLSEQELQLMYSADFILTKRRIIDSVCEMFAAVSIEMQQFVKEAAHRLPEIAARSSSKISKGENYLLLPYVILDYPKFFSHEDIFAVRTMFWWGNFFSVTLQLSGIYQSKLQISIFKRLTEHFPGKIFICVNKDQWQHHFEQDNYLPIQQFDEKDILQSVADRSFIKVAIRIPLQQPNAAQEQIIKACKDLLRLVMPNFQGGEKDLLPETPTKGFDL